MSKKKIIKALMSLSPEEIRILKEEYSISFNTENELMKVDDMPERIIQFHQSENGYGIGFAAGYSLLSSDTVNSKRKELTKQCFQFSQDERNKLYIRCIDYNKLTNQVLPSNTVKQFNYYYSYFNPSESDAMVYHYREGKKIVVYPPK